MNKDRAATFVNGVIAGAGIILSFMGIVYLRSIGPLEGIMGLSTTETRIAIFIGIIVSAIAILCEVYKKKEKAKINDAEQKF